MTRRVVVLALACMLALFAAAAAAQAADPVVTDLRIDQPPTLTVGDHVRYTVVVEGDDGSTLALAPSALPASLELLGTPRVSTRALPGGRSEFTLTFEVAPFVVGEIQVPPLPLHYTAPDGSATDIQASASIISVSSVLQQDDLQPRDLKPQAEIGAAAAAWPLPAAGGLIAAVVLLAAAVIWRRRARRRRAAYTPPRIPLLLGPEDTARAHLDEAGSRFAGDGDFVVYYTAIGNVVRNYLTQRYAFPAFALTTRELEAEMLHLGLDRWQVRVAGGLLSQCDAVVYAQYRPASERADADLTAAYEIVEIGRPREPEPAQEAAVS